jgi:dTDP-4-dehydrorhamnose 3,5-epimerase
MKVIKTEIPDVLIFEPKVFGDSRGYFMENFRNDIIQKHIGEINFVQDNESFSTYGTLRGLHFQKPPFTQSKLVRVIKGEVLDVAVDIRKGSPTFRKHISVRLSGDNKRQLWVPQGFAHGFVVLSETAIFSYKCDNYYAPDYDAGLACDDADLNIDWLIPEEYIKLSEKDTMHPKLDEAYCFE